MKEKNDKIKYAVMVNGDKIKRWQAEVLKQLNESNLCDCVLIISNPDSFEKRQGILKRVFKRGWFFYFLLNRKFKVEAEQEDNLPINIPVLTIKTDKKGASDYFSDADISKIKEYNPVFIIRFGYNILRGDILKVAEKGIWSFHHGDERKFRGGPFGFHEIRKKSLTTGVILQKLTSKLDAGHVLMRREYITVMHSWKEMRQRLLAENNDMVLLAVKKYLVNNEPIPAESATNAPIYRVPGFFSMLNFMFALIINRLCFHFKRLFIYEKWHVEVGLTENSPFNLSIPAITKITSKSNKAFYADPFLIQLDDKQLVLSEYFSYKSKLGEIYSTLSGEKSKPWLQKSSHLAYPYVFEHNGQNWVIPENANSGKCIAYCVDNELNIIDEKVLVNLPLVDASLLKYNDKFYIFCGLKGQLPNEKLFVFWADCFEGPYFPHEMNPVKVSPNGSRSGGSMIFWQNEVYRPTQVYAENYGNKVLINKIIELSPKQFIEEAYCEIAPDIFGKKYKGLHTYSVCNNHFAVDLKLHKFGFAAFGFRMKQNKKKGHINA